MKVLHLIDSGGLYGAEIVMLGLAEEQRRRGMDVCIGSIVTPDEGERAIEAEALGRGIAVRRIHMAEGFRPSSLVAAHRLQRDRLFDLIHTHGYKPDILMATTRPASQRPALVATLHGWTATTRLSKLWAYESLDRRLLPRFDAVVLVAEQLQRVHGLRRVSKLHLVPNGISPPLSVEHSARPIPTDVFEFCRRRPTILAVGRMSPEKNQRAMLHGIAAARRAGMDLQLLLVGDGPLRGHLEHEASRLGIASYCLMPGYIADANRLFPFVVCLIMTSISEGLPIIVLEAMRDQLPIVSTAAGDIASALDAKSAWLLPNTDSGVVVRSLGEVIQRGAAVERRTERARVRWLERYTLSRMVDGYDRVYRDATAVSRRWAGTSSQ